MRAHARSQLRAQARIGEETVAPPLSTTSALPNRPNGQRHKSTRHQSIGQRGFAVNREVSVQGRSWLIRRRGGFTMSSVAWVTFTVPVCLATTRFVAPCRWPALAADDSRVQIVLRRFPLGQRGSQERSSAGLLVSHRRRHRNPGGASVFRVQDPGESSIRLLSCAADLVTNIAPCSECS